MQATFVWGLLVHRVSNIRGTCKPCLRWRGSTLPVREFGIIAEKLFETETFVGTFLSISMPHLFSR